MRNWICLNCSIVLTNCSHQFIYSTMETQTYNPLFVPGTIKCYLLASITLIITQFKSSSCCCCQWIMSFSGHNILIKREIERYDIQSILSDCNTTFLISLSRCYSKKKIEIEFGPLNFCSVYKKWYSERWKFINFKLSLLFLKKEFAFDDTLTVAFKVTKDRN